MAIEIVDLPIHSMVIFHSYVNVCQRVSSFKTGIPPWYNGDFTNDMTSIGKSSTKTQRDFTELSEISHRHWEMTLKTGDQHTTFRSAKNRDPIYIYVYIYMYTYIYDLNKNKLLFLMMMMMMISCGLSLEVILTAPEWLGMVGPMTLAKTHKQGG